MSAFWKWQHCADCRHFVHTTPIREYARQTAAEFGRRTAFLFEAYMRDFHANNHVRPT